MQFGHIVSGAIMVEVVFTWIGMGNLMNTAINSFDFPTMQMCFLISAVCMVLSSVLSDVLYVALDPRIKES
jgi:peptide/nickel transport system permease protein